jgi:serine/threonine-protein kinase RsbW
MGRVHSLTVPGRYDRIRHVCSFVADGAAEAGFDKDSIFQVELACDEACTNIIEHTYKAEDVGSISISWQIKSRRFVVTIRDSGKNFDPTRVPSTETPPVPQGAAHDDDVRVGGLGLYFMRTLMDKVTHKYVRGRGNVLVMEKKLPGGKKP